MEMSLSAHAPKSFVIKEKPLNAKKPAQDKKKATEGGFSAGKSLLMKYVCQLRNELQFL